MLLNCSAGMMFVGDRFRLFNGRGYIPVISLEWWNVDDENYYSCMNIP